MLVFKPLKMTLKIPVRQRRKCMRWQTLILAVTIVLLLSAAAAGEYYQYNDKDGTVRFTDDASKIPENLRPQAKIFESVNSESHQDATEEETDGKVESTQTSAADEDESTEVVTTDAEDSTKTSAADEEESTEIADKEAETGDADVKSDTSSASRKEADGKTFAMRLTILKLKKPPSGRRRLKTLHPGKKQTMSTRLRN